MASRSISLGELVQSLCQLGPTEFQVDKVAEILSAHSLRESSITSLCGFLDNKYARHSIFRNDQFDMMLICWKPGQVTPVHSHNGQRGWVRVLRGRIQETRFQYRGCDSPQNFIGGEIDCIAGGGAIRLEEQGTRDFAVGPAVTSVDREQSIHRLGNVWQDADSENAVTLHVYSLPHDSCVSYDMETRTCQRRELAFDTTAVGRGFSLSDL